MVIKRFLWTAAALLAVSGALSALEVQLDIGDGQWIRPDEGFILRVDDPEARIAVIVDRTDVTDFMVSQEGAWRYRAEEIPLQPGEHSIRVFQVGDDGIWEEVATLSVQVTSEKGFVESSLSPYFNLEVGGPIHIDSDPEDPFLEEEIKATAQAGFQGAWQREGWGFNLDVDLMGASEVEQALRFYEEGEDAPRVDLSSYRLSWNRGETRVELGHTSFGASRYLIEGFSSRGLSMSAPLGSRLNVKATALSGTSVVGWDHLAGISRSGHRILAGELGLSLLPQGREGEALLTATFMDGKVEAETDFSQGGVTDRSESQGLSLGIRLATASQRFRFDGHFAQSEFENPFDESLAQGADLVDVEKEDRDARFVRAEFDLLQNHTLGEGTATMTLALEHERVDPLYSTVVARPQSDVERNGANLSFNASTVSVMLRYTDTRDNLDNIPSILTTDTEATGANFRWSPGSTSAEARVRPALSWSFDRVAQAGRELPVNGGFSDGHVPDQVSTNHLLGLEFAGNLWQSGYRLGLTEQDNRQPGRENDDFDTTVHTLFGNFQPSSQFDIGLELSREIFESLSRASEETTERLGVFFGYRPTERFTLDGNISFTTREENIDGRESDDFIGDLRATYRFLDRALGERRLGGSIFLRTAYSDNNILDPVFGLDEDRSTWRLDSGLSLSFR